MAVPAWPPHLQSLKGALLATELQHPAPPVRVNSLLYDARFHPSNDEQLASARVTQGDDVRQWTTAEQVGWILRRPIGEWLYYVRNGQRNMALLASRFCACDDQVEACRHRGVWSPACEAHLKHLMPLACCLLTLGFSRSTKDLLAHIRPTLCGTPQQSFLQLFHPLGTVLLTSMTTYQGSLRIKYTGSMSSPNRKPRNVALCSS